MTVLLGLGLLVGASVVLLVYGGLCLMIAESAVGMTVLCVALVLSLANLMGAGLLYTHMPLWGWLPAAISGGLMFGAVFMGDDGGW